jgi:NlpC/P60 family
MPRCLKKFVLFGFCFSFFVAGTARKSFAQEVRSGVTKFTSNLAGPDLPPDEPQPDSKDLLLLLGTQIHETEMDCSHFVQYLYESVGLYYGYAPSRILYDGMEGFRRVRHPEPGDLIVWRGHVGIVVDPEEATFLSALRSGVKTASYQSSYWKRRGRPHFLRYTGARNETTPKSVPSRTLPASASAE